MLHVAVHGVTKCQTGQSEQEVQYRFNFLFVFWYFFLYCAINLFRSNKFFYIYFYLSVSCLRCGTFCCKDSIVMHSG